MRNGLAVGRVFFTLSAFCLLLPGQEIAQAESSWQSLPAETIVAMRIPNGRVSVDSIVRDTKFGAVLFSEQRRAAVAKVLEKGNAEGWAKFQSRLKEHDLTTEELLGLLAGETGYAVVMDYEAGEVPEFTGLGWLEPGEELARKFYAALEKMIEDQDDEQPITRVDHTLADQPVMQLQLPSTEIEHEREFELGDEYDDLSEEEQEAAWDKAYAEWEESAVEVITHRTVLVCQQGGRLLVAHHFQSYNEDDLSAAAEQLSAVFGRWLAAHADGSGEFVDRVTEEPGAARVMTLEGESMFELLADVAPLLEILKTEEVLEEYGELATRLIGLEGVGPAAVRLTAQGTVWRTQMAFAAPAPRRGLMRLLDQEALAIDPPAWVPASAVSYYQVGFDLGEAYEIIKEEVLREFPDQAAPGFAMAEAQVQAFAKASLPEVLSSLGNRHTVLSFGFESGTSSEALAQAGMERMAVVWQIDDEPLWQRLLTALTPFAGMAQGVESAEEQGFSGWRMKSGALEGGLFVGKGYLVLGYGTGVTESMLSALNNPPSGSDALRGSPVFAKAGDLLDIEPALAAEVTDGDRYMRMAINAMEKQFKQLAKLMEQADEEDDEDEDLFLPLLQAIMPNSDEIRGMMGVIVSRYEVNDDGIFSETAQEMPAP